ncbi:MAG: protein kinase [Planctomycetes bacterium]|nr:protein kinase [Planctomycetota bacterium]
MSCPRDGSRLLERTDGGADSHRLATLKLGDAAEEPLESTAQIAGEMEDLIFKICSRCHTAYGGNFETCPQDGSRLVEPSMMARETMMLSGGFTSAASDLKKYCPACRRFFDLDRSACEGCGAPLEIPTVGGKWSADERSGRINSVIAGKYRLLSEIGAGGFGSVYLAKHESLGKRFAVKMLRTRLSGRTDFRNRFHEEALKLSRLEDENIVRVFDFGEFEDFQYMVTEYVEGENLGAVIYAEKASPLRAARLLRQVASALSEAHSKGIVHLDLKPGNILVQSRRGRDLAKVIDFGIAEICSRSGAPRQEAVTGTPTYMAPEQWRQEALDPRTDIYSFGVILYEFLAGRPPFRSGRLSELEKAHCGEMPALLRKLRPDIPAELEKLAHRCLEKDPPKRPQTAEEVEAALAAFARRSENALGRWLVRAGAAAAALVILAAAVWGLLEMGRDREPPAWTRLEAEGPGLSETPLPSGVKEYRTRAEKVQVRLEARDDRKINRIILRSAAIENGEASFTSDRAELTLPLILGRNELNAQAVDGAGNRSSAANMIFVRLPPRAVKVKKEGLPEHTSSETVALVFNELEGARVRILGRNPEAQGTGESPFEVEVEKAADGSFRFSGPGAGLQKPPRPGEPLAVAVKLRPGENALSLIATDLLNGESAGEEKIRTVKFLDQPLELKAAVLPAGKGLVLEANGGWLCAESQIQLAVEVPEAKSRLPEGAELRYRFNQEEDLKASAWSAEELSQGKKLVKISLPAEGPNRIAIEPLTDLYGIRSDSRLLSVILDYSPPQLEVQTKEVTYYGSELPAVRFRLSEEHPAQHADALELLDHEGRAVSSPHFKVIQGDDRWELSFLSADPFPSDGRHDFSIRAADRLGNRSEAARARFQVLVDRAAPLVDVEAPKPEQAFRRGDSITFRVRARDAFPESLAVAVKLTASAPGFAGERSLRLSLNPANGLWEGTVPVSREGIEKPAAFDSVEPRFQVFITARDASGRETAADLSLAFAWENGDRLIWNKDGSILAYHQECRARKTLAFFMGIAEVSNGQYEKFLEESPQGAASPRSPDWEDGRLRPDRKDLPVREVSWREAQAYARWAGLEPAGREEWLVAAFWDYEQTRERRFPWAGEELSKGGPPVRGGGERIPAAALPEGGPYAAGRTPFGLEHMFGNVWEMALERGSGRIVKLGGGFDTRMEAFRLDTEYYRKYLRGEPPDGVTIGENDGQHNLGFRCMLISK